MKTNHYLTTTLFCTMFLAACGGGSTDRTMAPMPPSDPGPSRDVIRVDVIEGNGDEIGNAVQAVVTNLDLASSTARLDTDDDRTAEPVAFGDGRLFDLGSSVDGVHIVGRTAIDADMTSYGYWLSVDETGETPVVTVGLHSSGPGFDTAPTLATSGTATYQGRAHGLHTVAYATGEFGNNTGFRIGEFDADVTLTADFGAMTMGGRIDNIMSTEEGVNDGALTESARSSRPYVLTLNAGSIDAGGFEGTVTVGGPQNISSSDGNWRGRLSSDANDAAGTFGATWTHTGGTVGQYVGAFVSQRQ